MKPEDLKILLRFALESILRGQHTRETILHALYNAKEVSA